MGIQLCSFRISLVVHWLRNHSAMQGTQVPSLVQEDPTSPKATKPTGVDYQAHAPEPRSHSSRSPGGLGSALHKRRHRREECTHRNEEEPCSLLLEKTRVQQQRPSTATRQSIFFFLNNNTMSFRHMLRFHSRLHGDRNHLTESVGHPLERPLRRLSTAELCLQHSSQAVIH